MQRSDNVPAHAGRCGEANVSEANVKGGLPPGRSQIRDSPRIPALRAFIRATFCWVQFNWFDRLVAA
jgi:hypothetical protein